MTPLFLVRHGQSEWNAAGRIQGRADSPLTALGRRQAERIGDALALVLGDQRLRVFSSPLGRALQTAELIAARLRNGPHAIRADERLNDFELGILSGYPGWDAVASDHPELARLRLDDPLRFQPTDGESGADVVVRISSFLDDVPDDGVATVIVCHGVINKFIRSVRRGITGAAIIALGESQYTVYRLDGVVEMAIELDVEEP